ncbi:hypothetical protein E2C01_022906 [Portunus trituberculatus]|uniref:Uncharacterized protein n=1 Tax=Portunus trituberculatus TaxID=210409 RepID=A0A5B7E6N7_PORTR|nr:hypothetical protein [Portunus trituberculatus]
MECSQLQINLESSEHPTNTHMHPQPHNLRIAEPKTAPSGHRKTTPLGRQNVLPRPYFLTSDLWFGVTSLNTSASKACTQVAVSPPQGKTTPGSNHIAIHPSSASRQSLPQH